MTTLIAGLVLFFAAHSVSIANVGWRDRMAATMGEWPWKGLYSVVSLVGFVMICIGYGQARMSPVLLYAPPVGLRHVALLLMVPVFPIFLATYFPGRIKAVLKHPTLVATKLWAVAHLLANGMLADVVLFGSFLAWAVADRISVKRRALRPPPEVPESRLNDVIAVVGGLSLYVAFVFWLHHILIGIPLIARG